mmetsp:Transcript_8954/g.22204  ORF Transcript_8954/g.22204 Transcript_8954/m.22204 type:complete len:251 (+) Transcript_8954:1011-1763(+)
MWVDIVLNNLRYVLKVVLLSVRDKQHGHGLDVQLTHELATLDASGAMLAPIAKKLIKYVSNLVDTRHIPIPIRKAATQRNADSHGPQPPATLGIQVINPTPAVQGQGLQLHEGGFAPEPLGKVPLHLCKRKTRGHEVVAVVGGLVHQVRHLVIRHVREGRRVAMLALVTNETKRPAIDWQGPMLMVHTDHLAVSPCILGRRVDLGGATSCPQASHQASPCTPVAAALVLRTRILGGLSNEMCHVTPRPSP